MSSSDFFDQNRCLVVAEIAQAHDGSLGTAHAYIDAVADAGADAIKFQTHYADYESSPDEPFRVKFSQQDETRYDYWKRLEFTPDQWRGLAAHCEKRNIHFLSSAFSTYAVEVLESCNVPAWKLASGEISNSQIIDRMCSTGKPLLVSSGMSGWDELDWAVKRIRGHGNSFAILQCTTAYPCPPEKIGLNVMEEMRKRYDTYVGLSDHSGTMWPAIAGTMLGMNVLEVHVAFHRASFGPDVPASLTLEELGQAISGIRFTETMRDNPVNKEAAVSSFEELRGMFTQGLVAARDLPQGTVLEPDALTTRKPLRGIPASQYDDVLGRTLRVSVEAGMPLEEAHLV